MPSGLIVRKLGADLSGFDSFESLSAEERQAIFEISAGRLGIVATNVEKDYWVCRILAVMMRTPPFTPKRFFKGGTSLSKGFGLINRFSEDIDVVLARSSLLRGEADPFDPATPFDSRKKKEKAQKLVFEAARSYVHGAMKSSIERRCSGVRVDIEDVDLRQPTLLVWYPSVFPPHNGTEAEYNKRRVKIETGPRGAREPIVERTIVPYIQDDLGTTYDLAVKNVTIIRPARTMLEKVSAIHGMIRRHQSGEAINFGANPSSRHLYDVAMMIGHDVGQAAVNCRELINAVCADTRATFGAKFAVEIADGRCVLVPPNDLRHLVAADYQRSPFSSSPHASDS